MFVPIVKFHCQGALNANVSGNLESIQRWKRSYRNDIINDR